MIHVVAQEECLFNQTNLYKNTKGKSAICQYTMKNHPPTWKLAKMNLAIRGIDNNLGPHQGDTFTNDLHKGERFDYILANPPFNIKNWDGDKLKDDARWKYGVPPESNTNYAWTEHIISKLAPDGKAGFVLANGALSTSKNDELAIRKAILEDDKLMQLLLYLVKCFIQRVFLFHYGLFI